MANSDDIDELLDGLTERLKTMREDAELARSIGCQSVSAALDCTRVRLHDLANSLEALCLQVGQQQEIAERYEATAAKHEAETQALKQTIEALSVQLQRQAETLDRLSARRRSRLSAHRIGLAIAILLGGSIAVWSGHVASFGPLQRRLVDWLSEFGGINLSSSGRPPLAHAASNSEPASARQRWTNGCVGTHADPAQEAGRLTRPT